MTKRGGLCSRVPNHPHCPTQRPYTRVGAANCTLPMLAQLEAGVPRSPAQGLRTCTVTPSKTSGKGLEWSLLGGQEVEDIGTFVF